MRPLFLGLGILALLVGAVWTLQGADLLPGSFMTGITFWLVAGVILLVLGAATLFLGTRSPRAKRAA